MLRFGTDGIRGDAEADLTPQLVRALGRAVVSVLGHDRPFVIGRDTRRSGPAIEGDLAAGIAAEGGAARSLGVIPTPGVAHVAQQIGGPGAVISASHNPWSDNGIKLFAPGGRKLSDEDQGAVEEAVAAMVGAHGTAAYRSPDPAASPWPEGRELYVEHLVNLLDGRDLAGLRLVVDCANGAASEIAPRVFDALGARVEVINARPDGTNINEGCGSTDPSRLRETVLAVGAEAGLAFDGDADRVLAVDERGEVLDGDQMMLVAARDLDRRGLLRNRSIALTVMSNLGLRRALEAEGIGVVETPVGDRHVLQALEANDLVLGGEQSGHVIFRDRATTGDGILTGILLLDCARRSGRSLADLGGSMRRYPQVLKSVRVASAELVRHPELRAVVSAVETDLGEEGRVLVRASGTEPVIRVMVEAADGQRAEAAVERISDALRAIADGRPPV